MWAALAGFAALSGLTLWAVWRESDIRPVSVALIVSYLLSNFAHFWLPPFQRPAAYTVVEVLVAAMALLARMCGAPKSMVILVGVCTVSVSSNVAISFFLEPNPLQTNLWEAITNVCFAMECLIVIATGVWLRDRVRRRAVRHGADTFCDRVGDGKAAR